MTSTEQRIAYLNEAHREHELINHRTGWYMTTQAVLTASLIIANSTGELRLWASLLLACIGIWTTIVHSASIYAAMNSQRFFLDQIRGTESDVYHERDLAHPWIHRWGLVSVQTLPIVFAFVWLVVGGWSFVSLVRLGAQ